MVDEPKVGYFSMEMALEAGMPTYSGGLGVLAGDVVRAAADLKVPVVYSDRSRFIDVMLHSIAINGSFFNTERMVLQYVLKAYFI